MKLVQNKATKWNEVVTQFLYLVENSMKFCKSIKTRMLSAKYDMSRSDILKESKEISTRKIVDAERSTCIYLRNGISLFSMKKVS